MMTRISIYVANGMPIQALSILFKIVLILVLVFAPVGRPTIRAVDAGSMAHSRRDSWRPEPLAAPATSTWARNTCAPAGSLDSSRRPWSSLAQDVLIRVPPLFR